MQNFQELKLHKELDIVLAKINFTVPTPIQSKAIPFILNQRDVLGSAHTGTGKTAAFCIPLIHLILNNKCKQAIILAPTRELAKQIESVVQNLTPKKSPVKSLSLVGGEPIGKQLSRLRSKPQIIIGTPGRNILDGVTDPLQVRAAELLFRDQVVTLDDGRIMVADHATVQLQIGMQKLQGDDNAGNETAIDILATETADEYWPRSDQFNTSVDMAFTQPALDGLARVMEKWVSHFLSLNARITPMLQIEDESWAWHLGLDAQATSILNDLYQGKDVDDTRLRQILCLFKLEADSGFAPEMQGKPIYMGLAMDATGVVRFKPQNLLMNLPLATQS